MRITEFRARGFRSLGNVCFKPRQGASVLYGPNGAGKSTILRGIRLAFELASLRARSLPGLAEERDEQGLGFSLPVQRMLDGTLPAHPDFPIGPDDLSVFAERWPIELGLDIEGAEGPLYEGPRLRIDRLLVDLSIRPTPWNSLAVSFTRLQADGSSGSVDLREIEDLTEDARAPVLTDAGLLVPAHRQDLRWQIGSDLHELLKQVLSPTNFALIPATRLSTSGAPIDAGLHPAQCAQRGAYKEALFRARSHSDAQVRQSYTRLERMLGPILAKHRQQQLEPGVPPFVPTIRQPGGPGERTRIDLRLPLPGGRDTSVDFEGTGIAQLLATVTSIVLSNSPVVAIEEPECNLHAPTLGMALRGFLAELASSPQAPHQLIISTHSNLFDIDPDGFFDVRFGEAQGTVLEWMPKGIGLDRHLYEPGPVRRVLERRMTAMGGDEIVFRSLDGHTRTADDVTRALQEDAPWVHDYLMAVQSAAVRLAGAASGADEGE